MIRLHSAFPSDWKHTAEHGSTLRAEKYKDKIAIVILNYDNVGLAKAMIDRDIVVLLRDYLDEYLRGEPMPCRTGIFD